MLNPTFMGFFSACAIGTRGPEKIEPVVNNTPKHTARNRNLLLILFPPFDFITFFRFYSPLSIEVIAHWWARFPKATGLSLKPMDYLAKVVLPPITREYSTN